MTPARRGLIRRYRALSPEGRRAVLQAAVLVGGLRAALLVFPFRTVLRTVNRVGPRREARTAPLFDKDLAAWSISAAGRRLAPRNPCLPEALAMLFRLRRAGLPGELHLGVARGENGSLRAHAWVETAGEIVIGGDVPVEEYERLPQLEARNL